MTVFGAFLERSIVEMMLSRWGTLRRVMLGFGLWFPPTAIEAYDIAQKAWRRQKETRKRKDSIKS